ncbi:MAG: hypothetical protein ACD_3C00018G0016 [uncultured bacterium (gcode 4)]|uniref:Uncharacterized protein n=1 Tax=uncultured bacterium (gcode 4) TaxID=1234023 RepID=K2G379_9BACT|nr:MAG: hypothetical protein ACD_3C00018G0016 [uncultured bacterium (gcode 4)]
MLPHIFLSENIQPVETSPTPEAIAILSAGVVVQIQTFHAEYEIFEPLEVHKEPDEARVETLVFRSAILSAIWFQIVFVNGSQVFTGESALYAPYHIDNTHKVEKKIRAEYSGFLKLVCIKKN